MTDHRTTPTPAGNRFFAGPAWHGPDDARQLAAGTVFVFEWQIDQSTLAAPACLTEEETDRADRFRFDGDRTAFVAAHAGLRAVLGECLACEPADVPLVAGPQGKPALADEIGEPVAFNLTHSGGAAMLAIGNQREVGVDVELVPTDKPISWPVARRCFVGEELAALESANENDARNTFYRLWTRKEAVVKLLGEGLQAPLTEFTVDPGPETAGWVDLPANNPLGVGRCWLQSLPIEGQYAAALACVDQPTAIVRRTLELAAV